MRPSLNCPICKVEVEASSFKEAYVSPYNNQEYKRYECPNCFVENVKRNLGIDTVFARSLEEFYEYAKEKNLKFDVITFFEVLEHQDKPREFLEMVKGLLKDGGYIVESVPNRERLFVEIGWKYFHGDHPPHHFLRFSKYSLEKALNFSGFKDIEVYKLDSSFIKLFPYLEKKLFGNIDKLKIKLKGMVLWNERKARVYAVEELAKVSPSKGKAYILMMLKLIRNAILLPFALGYVGKLKNGFYLYFKAKI